jgi:hypothetical protein
MQACLSLAELTSQRLLRYQTFQQPEPEEEEELLVTAAV